MHTVHTYGFFCLLVLPAPQKTSSNRFSRKQQSRGQQSEQRRDRRVNTPMQSRDLHYTNVYATEEEQYYTSAHYCNNGIKHYCSFVERYKKANSISILCNTNNRKRSYCSLVYWIYRLPFVWTTNVAALCLPIF